ncbi:P-loop containing nucleoside triphosphate hydrolase protein [Crucibulum laeve]|uniref:P-loop containing nucleoside triphosphate hydrolase protein n=1 Tax=Crucibulum laeve TaxID=68775 RepID=A0A5C3LJC9_9AGAR|nr:P-loop containing nucleoside triphosphate hydrolase protein [Crucibulum laeve]
MARILKLNKLLDSVLQGKQAISPSNGNQFLEAVYSQSDPTTCVSRLCASNTGLNSVKIAMRYDLSPAFLNGVATNVLQFLESPELEAINGGQYLQDIILAIVEPPIFWLAFCQAYEGNKLDEKGQHSFAWLLFHLVSFPAESSDVYRIQARSPLILTPLTSSTNPGIATFGKRIQDILTTRSIPPVPLNFSNGSSPGGRHDNDFEDFRKVSILPTANEIDCTEQAFLRPSEVLDDPQTKNSRVSLHLDNQFRLLREDMLYEMREELQIATGKKKGHHRGITIKGLSVVSVYCGKEGRRCKCGIAMQCKEDLPQFKGVKERKKYLLDHRNFLRHQSLGCLVVGNEIVAFPTLHRDEDLLVKTPPIIILLLDGEGSSKNALRKLKTDDDVKLIQIDTAIFSYEPVLKALQQATLLPLSNELLMWEEDSVVSEVICQASPVVQALRNNPHTDLSHVLNTKSIKLDGSQVNSLLAGLTQKLSMIQGPPGTGKSFIGALLAKALHDFTQQTILVVCYTNHALDDILTGLLDIGIPETSMVRLGGKSTARTEPLTLQNQPRTSQLGKSDWAMIQSTKDMQEDLVQQLNTAFDRYTSFKVQSQDVLDHLEFEYPSFYAAFHVPESLDGMTRVGMGGRAVTQSYLIDRWMAGKDAGQYAADMHLSNSTDIWSMSNDARRIQVTQWETEILQELLSEIHAIATEHNRCQDRIDHLFSGRDIGIMQNKRIIGCTTTAAAKYTKSIQAVSPDVVLVEEAGEILESHILTALGSHANQLILIGDHKQLRPKVNHYLLTVEKGEGYDLNMSLFERLIVKGYPHESLTEQHRMRPEISALIRHLTYPELVDAARTKNRPDLHGVQDNIVFIDHDHPEDEDPRLRDRRDMASTSSKQNSFEADMVLKIVRYLAQQGYGSDKLVILTPYLGQLQKLKEILRSETDPVLNDLDTYDLVRAGLMSAATAKMTNKPIRLATIDNYQGEESEIVIVSLTRSNAVCDIGFMFSPERLNVLLSRARNALIMIGNSQTFRNARRGKELWRKLFELLGGGKHIYSGFPIVCRQHPDRKMLLSQPSQFDEECPGGGCDIPCGTMLNCGQHRCPSKCHQLFDHSKMVCEHWVSSNCQKGHVQRWQCGRSIGPGVCKKCERDAAIAEKRRKQEFAAQQKRDAEEAEHLRQVAELDAKIAHEADTKRDACIAEQRRNAIQQKQKDLLSLQGSNFELNTINSITQGSVSRTLSTPATTGLTPQPPSTVAFGTAGQLSSVPEQTSQRISSSDSLDMTTNTPSPSQQEWRRQKSVEGSTNEFIDAIMAMVGLESVKEKILEIKAKIDTSTRQGASLHRERFNITFLGNPGTGKTTVARHYANFLASVKVIPRNEFFETTGSRLANEGVDGIKKQIEMMLNAGGGVVFIDEAYQLTSSHNVGGAQVLDFLLAEMENNVGKLVFILAGYSKEMEKYFEHNPGLRSRVPHELRFMDYTDKELLLMLQDIVQKEFHGRMKVEGGIQGLYCRIAVRRLGRRRGHDGFGNARDLQNLFTRIRGRQALRLSKERRSGQMADDFELSAEDVIGPDPSQAMAKSTSWERLQNLTGLKDVKESVRTLVDSIQVNYRRELEEKEPIQISLHRVFLGSPGTGKTTVAKLYGQILADLGLLSKGEVLVKNPADFIGSHIGESEAKTKGILANAMGKVLVIDEAYMLHSASDGHSSGAGAFKTAVIDAIVAEVQSEPGEDRCLLLLGYKEQMMNMFQNVNAGLTRRFKIEDAFNFEDFSESELLQILNFKLKEQNLAATDDAKAVAMEVLNRNRMRPNFGNAGEVENLLGKAKGLWLSRFHQVAAQDRPTNIVFEPQDFDTAFNRASHASIADLFSDIVGHDDVKRKITEYQQIANTCKARKVDPRERIPTNFVFKGPPGTGKTTIARKMGQVYFDMGILSTRDVIECSASDLVGEYVGHTGPKTRKLFEKALGKVLFIDEAYRLGEGRFAQEAVDELVGLLTHESFKSKVIVILAGYDEDMNKLLSVNSGLSSRFPNDIIFHNMEPAGCLEVLRKQLQKNNVCLDDLADASSAGYHEMTRLVKDLTSLPGWGNARDMVTLSTNMINFALLNATGSDAIIKLEAQDAIGCTRTMITERSARKLSTNRRHVTNDDEPPVQGSSVLPASPVATRAGTSTAGPPTQRRQQAQGRSARRNAAPPSQQPQHRQQPPQQPQHPQRSQNLQRPQQHKGPRQVRPQQTQQPQQRQEPQQSHVQPRRDSGVSDEEWRQLQTAQRAAETAEREAQRAISNLRRERDNEIRRMKAQRELVEQPAREQAQVRDHARREELKRKHEEARMKEQAARAAKAQAERLLQARKEQEKRKREQEAKAQQKLRELGRCPVGYRWINRGSFYQCEGGSHRVATSELGL